MEQESIYASILLLHFRWSNFPPSEGPAGLWAELGPQKTMSAGCTMPSNDNRGLELNLLCTASKNPIPHSYCQGDPTVASSVCLGHGAASRAQGGGAWGAALLPLILWTSHSTGLCCAALQTEPKVLWLFPCLCQLVGAGYYYCIIILLSPPRHGTKGLPLMEKILTPAFASLFPSVFSFPASVQYSMLVPSQEQPAKQAAWWE